MSKVYISVDMDYSSDPIWTSKTGDYWINDDLDGYKKLFSAGLMHSLYVYQQIWEASNWSSYLSPSDMINVEAPGMFMIQQASHILSQACAVQIKKEFPDWHVFYWCDASNTRKEVIL
ncbi:hypothetical protein FOI42_RS03755 [Escherichia coli]|nr:hypothetical protein [Escherichia coli]EFL4883751.1 hypothetical protein [Escherichia coli]MED6699428.1 hypothetical protein [Escherichia coli O157]